MSDIHVRREHSLGLARARELADQWSANAESRWGMRFSRSEGEGGDTMAFEGSGASGELQVGADYFDLSLQLGILLSPFKKRLEADIERNLDELVAQGPPAPGP